MNMLQYRSWYESLIIDHPKAALFLVLILTCLMAISAKDFELDASAESLVIEGDPDYRAYREVAQRYGAGNFLVLTYTPDQALFNLESLATLVSIRDEIRQMPNVQSVVSVMDVPLLSNPPVPIDQLVSNVKSLESPGVDVELAKKELANSPLYVNMLLSLEHNTTALQINFPHDEIHANLLETRQLILDSGNKSELSASDLDKLDSINTLIRQHSKEVNRQFSKDIAYIRNLMTKYDHKASMHLGGVPMLAEDIMNFVRKDLVTFGLGVLIFLIVTLSVIFRQWQWVLLPLLTCGTVVIFMMGMLGKLHWQVTVISSNFISLLLIMTMSMTIHLMVRYRQLTRKKSDKPQKELVRKTVRQIFIPCLYMALTTGVAFISLVVSGIRPVINFGLMMTAGIIVAFIIVFIMFPALMMVQGKLPPAKELKGSGRITRFLANQTLLKGQKIILAAVVLAGVTVVGISKLVVENSFIDYFDENTEIHQGMTVIDQRLGGTTPLEILIDFPGTGLEDQKEPESEPDTSAGGDFVDEDFFGDMDNVSSFDADVSEEENPGKYWFTQDKIKVIKQAHQFIQSQPGVGKVISLATMIEIAEGFNDGQPLSDVQLALLYGVIPEEFRRLVINPYVSLEIGQARLNARILDSDPDLNRNDLLNNIENGLPAAVGIDSDRVHLAGMMVLYNNMLQSLFQSQISTLGMVFAGIMIMFVILFRSVWLSLIAMVPNMLAAMLVLGIMGLLKIPLDIMTITIAAITIGIAVDNTIHYIVRFRLEFEKDHNYRATLRRSHNTIGVAMFYTSLTIIMGFSILIMSNFKPTIYFGGLTALAMFVALIGALTLLPQLLVVFRPLGPNKEQSGPRKHLSTEP